MNKQKPKTSQPSQAIIIIISTMMIKETVHVIIYLPEGACNKQRSRNLKNKIKIKQLSPKYGHGFQ